MSRFQTAIHKLWARLNGSAVESTAELPTYLSTRALIPADSRLEKRIVEAAREVQKDERKTPESVFLQRLRAAAQRNLIEDWPRDANGSPLE